MPRKSGPSTADAANAAKDAAAADAAAAEANVAEEAATARAAKAAKAGRPNVAEKTLRTKRKYKVKPGTSKQNTHRRTPFDIDPYMMDVFNKVNLAAIHAKRVTIQKKDIQHWKEITNWNVDYNTTSES
ncbi:hypothetical protein LTR08_003110 [Meristemomyces frigidus]|nr:hypothetical protein LTR08_003110 [Meristemomyces frigidus]